MRRFKTLLPVILVSASTSLAQEAQHEDILVSMFTVTAPQASAIAHHQADGTSLTPSVSDTGAYFFGCALTRTGLGCVSFRYPATGINLYDLTTGLEVASFNTSAFVAINGDTDVFSDDTLAVVDQGGDVDLFTSAGVYVRTLSAVGIEHPFGLFVDIDDRLWLADRKGDGDSQGAIWCFAQDGTLLDSFATNFSVGDLVKSLDGTLWATDYDGDTVHHLDSTGVVLGSFTAALPQPGRFSGIGIVPGGSLRLTSANSSAVYHQDATGQLLGSFQLQTPGEPLFLNVIDSANDTGTPFCSVADGSLSCPCGNDGGEGEGCINSAGVGGRLIGSGSALAGYDSWALTADQCPPNKPGVFFQGTFNIGAGVGISFGDGVRCVGGAIARLELIVTDGSGTAATSVRISQVGEISPGDTRYYQYWYRDPSGTCDQGFNVTNALEQSW